MVDSQATPETNQDDDSYEEVYQKQKRDRDEYMKALNKWLDGARLWHYNICSSLPFNVDNTYTSNDSQPQQQIYRNITQANLWQNYLRQGVDNAFVNTNVPTPLNATTNQTTLPAEPPSTYEFVIPPLWKRAVAELMDFLLLFLFKMALTFLLLESFDIIDMGFYGFESFQKNLENSEVAMPMAIELLTLELLHRVIICAYETYCLKGKHCATPGKRYMGLMVITADNISPIPGRLNDTVAATGVKTLGWHKSLIRACLKNLFVGLFLPLCVAFYIFPHNRTSYDMMSNSIVVEYHREFIMYNAT